MGTSSWVLGKGYSPRGLLGTGTGSAGQWTQYQAYQYSRSVWTMKYSLVQVWSSVDLVVEFHDLCGPLPTWDILRFHIFSKFKQSQMPVNQKKICWKKKNCKRYLIRNQRISLAKQQKDSSNTEKYHISLRILSGIAVYLSIHQPQKLDLESKQKLKRKKKFKKPKTLHRKLCLFSQRRLKQALLIIISTALHSAYCCHAVAEIMIHCVFCGIKRCQG